MSVRIAPSVLSADLGRLKDQIALVEAGGDLAYPFVTPGTVRVQQLFRASQFTLFPTGTTYRITGMAVRADSGGLGGAFQVSDQMTITAGATSLTGNTFGANMDLNVH